MAGLGGGGGEEQQECKNEKKKKNNARVTFIQIFHFVTHLQTVSDS